MEMANRLTEKPIVKWTILSRFTPQPRSLLFYFLLSLMMIALIGYNNTIWALLNVVLLVLVAFGPLMTIIWYNNTIWALLNVLLLVMVALALL